MTTSGKAWFNQFGKAKTCRNHTVGKVVVLRQQEPRLSDRQKIGKWVPALATLVVLLFSASAGIGNGKALERPLQLAINGFGAPAQPNDASNIAAAAGPALWVTKPTKLAGSKKSVAVLDGHRIQKTVLIVSRSRQIAFASSRDFVFVAVTSVRGPPAPSFAI